VSACPSSEYAMINCSACHHTGAVPVQDPFLKLSDSNICSSCARNWRTIRKGRLARKRLTRASDSIDRRKPNQPSSGDPSGAETAPSHGTDHDGPRGYKQWFAQRNATPSRPARQKMVELRGLEPLTLTLPGSSHPADQAVFVARSPVSLVLNVPIGVIVVVRPVVNTACLRVAE